MLIFMRWEGKKRWDFSTLFLSAERLFEIDQSQSRISNYEVLLSARLISREICLKTIKQGEIYS